MTMCLQDYVDDLIKKRLSEKSEQISRKRQEKISRKTAQEGSSSEIEVKATKRFRSSEELEPYNIKIPVSLKKALTEVAKEKGMSAASIANQMFKGDEEMLRIVNERRNRILKHAILN